MKSCCLFSYPDAETASQHMNFEVIEKYGSMYKRADGTFNILHTWDDGDRTLLRCKRCNALFLRQRSEYHDMAGGNDCYYTDYYPVDSRDEAISLNEKYDGFSLEMKYKGTVIKHDNTETHNTWHWKIASDMS